MIEKYVEQIRLVCDLWWGELFQVPEISFRVQGEQCTCYGESSLRISVKRKQRQF